jgi:NAD(P)-dependent dehydrogenase (short-subunit alcohol dehydrogenase family)
MNLENKTCLITGGTRGIGAATAIALAEHGANVVLAARRIDAEAGRVRTRVESLGRRCVLIGADLGKAADATSCVERTLAEFGALDVVVHSAGGPVNGGLFDITPAHWYAAFDLHVHAVFHLCRAALPGMRKRREGVIILVSSVAGLRGLRTNVAYQAVKGALPQLARALAFEFASENVRINCVAPGVIRTDFHSQMPEEVRRNNLENRIPLRREGRPDQAATVIRELITNDYITGETFVVDGGLTMRIC